MEMLSRLKPAVVGALACAVLVTLCVLYIDRPVAHFVAELHRRNEMFFEMMASPSLLSLPAACMYFVIYLLRVIAGRPAGTRTDLFLALSLSIVVAAAAKDELQWLIGRPWPVAWIRLGVYQIKPFTDDYYYGSFPSGHTSYVAAPMFVLWWKLPRYRVLWLGIVFVVMTGLVLSGYHWVGDVTAGFFLGMAVAAGTLAVRPRASPPVLAMQRQSQVNRRSPRRL